MTGWTLHLAQDECKALGKWFASRIDARYVLRKGIEMTLRQQLDFAAKAMGLAGRWHKREHEYSADDGFLLFTGVRWSPDTDQADSDRMACRLRIDTYLSGSDGDSFYVEALTYNRTGKAKDLMIERHVTHNNTDEDVCRAVREARLLVAVEIGKGMNHGV